MTLSLPSGSSRLAAIAAAVWVVQPFTSGTVIGEALSVTADPFRSLVSAGAWALWLVVLLALAFPHPVSLTVARIGAVGGVMASVWAAVEAPSSTGSGLVTIGVLASAAAFVTINLPGLGDRFVDGVSYGDEQRFLLRAPGPALFTLIGPAAMIVVLGASVGPLLLADQQWIAGAIATVVGFAIAVVPFMALHRLTSRFLVFVPNGLVVHDRTQLRAGLSTGQPGCRSRCRLCGSRQTLAIPKTPPPRTRTSTPNGPCPPVIAAPNPLRSVLPKSETTHSS